MSNLLQKQRELERARHFRWSDAAINEKLQQAGQALGRGSANSKNLAVEALELRAQLQALQTAKVGVSSVDRVKERSAKIREGRSQNEDDDPDRLHSLVVKASDWRAGGPGFNPD